MKVLVTGAAGFVGQTLVCALQNIANGNDRRAWLAPLRGVRVMALDRDNAGELPTLAAQADAVVHLAGINRADDPRELSEGNAHLMRQLVAALEAAARPVPVIFASSIQAALDGRFAQSLYGQGKREAERELLAYAERSGAPVAVYRLPGVFGKWCRPYYNSVVATFCARVAHGLAPEVNDPSVELALVHVDDVVDAWLHQLAWLATHATWQPLPEGSFAEVSPVAHCTVGELAALVSRFGELRATAHVPSYVPGSFEAKLRSTFESYLPPEAWDYPLARHDDERGSFAEFLKTPASGQVSLNVCKPGYTKGNHWHHHKWERFLVVSGEALIRLRPVPRAGVEVASELRELQVRGSELRVVEMPPGYAHSITNTSPTDDLVFVIWSNEVFDPQNPDTFALEV